jgi:hypothetical protein
MAYKIGSPALSHSFIRSSLPFRNARSPDRREAAIICGRESGAALIARAIFGKSILVDCPNDLYSDHAIRLVGSA